MSQEVKKGPFAALTFESSKNFILRYFQKLMWFYLLVIKDSLLGKVLRENFFPMRNALDRSYRDRLLKSCIVMLGSYQSDKNHDIVTISESVIWL